MSWLFSNVQYKLLALFVAFLLWSVSQSTGSVERGFDVPVSLEIPDTLVVTSRSSDAVNIRVQGSRAELRSLSSTDLEYSIDLSGGKPGRAEFEVDVTQLLARLPRGARIVSRSPTELEFDLEVKDTRDVIVNPDIMGEPADGFVIAGVYVEPTSVRVTGPRREVRRLTEVLTETIDVDGARATLEQKVRPSLRGPNLRIEQEQEQQVTVRVQVVPLPQVVEEETEESR